MSLLHDQWHRVRALQPRWRDGVRMDRQSIRGQRWYLLSDDSASKTVRLDARAYAIVGRCDGRRSVEQIWLALLADDASQGTTQGDVMALLTRLIDDALLECEGASDLAALGTLRQDAQRRERRARLMPWALRLRLGDPSTLLDRCDGLARLVFGTPGLIAWLALVLAAAWLAIERATPLASEAAQVMASPSAWLLAWLVFVPMKALHEAAHALTIRRFGANVHEAGIGLLLGMPAPYVDASEASRLASAKQRALVSAAGILTELAVAAIGLLVWSISDAGSVAHRLALIVALTGGVSTLWFNANPLARMDGYYLLTDLAQLPNLAERSNQWWREHGFFRLLGVSATAPLRPAPRERRWLIGYAPAAWIYRIGLCAWLTVWLGSHYAPAGIALAIASATLLFVLPLARLLRAAQTLSSNRQQHASLRLRLASTLAAAVLLAMALPLPDRIIAVGVVWVPEPAQIRAADDGFVSRLDVVDGQAVVAGQPIVQLDDPLLQAEARRLDAERDRLTASRSATLFNDPAQGAVWTAALQQIDVERERLDARIGSLSTQAPLAGRLSLPFAVDLPGRYYRRGERIADVLDERAPIVRLALAADQVTRIAGTTPAVRLGFSHRPWQAIDADLLRDAPAPIERLPSAALGSAAGGPIEVDPRDDERLKPLRPVYALDVKARGLLTTYPGERVDVSIDCGWQTLAAIAMRELRQTFRASFSAQAL